MDGGEVMWTGNVVAVGNFVYPMWVKHPLLQHFVLRTVPIKMISDWLTKETQEVSLDLIPELCIDSGSRYYLQSSSGIVNIKHLN